METYIHAGKKYQVEEVECFGAIINVNGTSITDLDKMGELTGSSMYKSGGYTVFVDGDEVWFKTFEQAYDFAMTKQKDTCRLEPEDPDAPVNIIG